MNVLIKAPLKTLATVNLSGAMIIIIPLDVYWYDITLCSGLSGMSPATVIMNSAISWITVLWPSASRKTAGSIPGRILEIWSGSYVYTHIHITIIQYKFTT